MTNKVKSIIFCAIGASLITYGSMNFELGGIDSMVLAMMVSISIVIGAVMFLYGIYALFKDKTITTANKGEKPMAEKKKANLMNDEQDAVLSVDLMKREKELETRRKELESLLAEVSKEEKAVEKQLIEKGWVNKNGSWGIE